jgi:asparagine synthase (glutamine-hydrolysing)
MCGISGIYNFRGKEPVDAELLLKMNYSLKHRGPDDEGIYIDKNLGFGHRRLSIVDLSGGHQPMCNEDGSIWITFNGEIYNHNSLSRTLKELGHKYETRCDTETILHLYEEKGLDCLEEMEGMFAFAIWDKRIRRLFLARDRLGIKPLYYTFQGGVFIFASEIKAILQHPKVNIDLDETALYHYLTFAATPSPNTLFKNICKLPNGHYLTMDEQGNCKIVTYWDPLANSHTNGKSYGVEYYAGKIRELLEESIEAKMMSDVPVGAFLSGGIDSTTNVAIMSRLTGRQLETFSVGFKTEAKYNEFEFARQCAREFETNHHEILIDENDLVKYVPEMVYTQDEPIADPVCVPLYYLSKLARENSVIVLHVGEGSDELFCGYPFWIILLKLCRLNERYFNLLPSWLRRAVYQRVKPFFKVFNRRTESELLRRASYDQRVFWGGSFVFSEEEKMGLLTSQYKNRNRELDSYSVVERSYQRFKRLRPEGDLLGEMIYFDLNFRLPELLLMRVDKITMSQSIEARVPFLDHRLVEFGMEIPTNVKIANDIPKFILKKAVEGIIPRNIINRKKQGFDAPVREWFSGKLSSYVSEKLLNSPIKKREIFNLPYIEDMLQTHVNRKANHGYRLWNLVNLFSWYEHWIENN